MAVNEEEVADIAELTKRVLEVASDLPEGSSLWYRGQKRANYGLLPGLLREGKEHKDIFERERRLLTRFRQRSLAYWPEGYPQNDWEHLFAMQHYGIPTRLLDFSENLFIAVHFALSPKEENEPALWCIDPVAWNRGTPVLSEFGEQIHILTTIDDESEPYRPETTRRRNKSPIAIYGTHNSNRIVAQRGTFMVWGEDTKPLQDFAAENPAQAWKFTIKKSHAELLAELNYLGFFESMVFPELSSLASEISRVEGWR